MRKLILRSLAMTFIMCFLGLASIAQSGDQKRDRKPMDVEQRLEKMTEDLNLTDQQIPQVKAILVKYGDQMKALHESRNETRGETRGENSGEKKGEMREEMKALKTAQKEELSLVLTDEQNQKMEEQLEKRAQRKGERKSRKEGK